MKVAIIGSRSLDIQNIGKYLPENVTEIVSGGAKGIDSCAADYASHHGIKLTVFSPEYEKYGKAAPLKRNLQIIEYSDIIIAFWEGKSKGTKYVIDTCQKKNKPLQVILM